MEERPAEEQIKKLPRWTRCYIQDMENRQRDLEQALESATAKNVQAGSRVMAQIGMDDLYEVPVPECGYSFKLKGKQEIEVMLREDDGRPVLSISGHHELFFQPRAANCIYILPGTVQKEE
jgi:nicotinamide mononucleotide adenylyltransferase